MVTLSSVQSRFEIPFSIIEGGSGTFHGVIAEIDQHLPPSYVFTAPRAVLRVSTIGLLKTGTVIQSPEGIPYLVGYNGPSENRGGTLWDSFRLFYLNKQVLWQRRGKIIDPVTRLEQDNGLELMGNIWAVIEPIDRETLDRKVHTSFEANRYLCGPDVRQDDILDGKQVSRSDALIGLHTGTTF
jgi:hypothetical protein